MLRDALPATAGLLWLLWVGYTVWVWRQAAFGPSFRQVWAMPWGKQMTFDLWLALACFGLVVFLNEPSPWVAAAWVLPSLLLGNLVTLLYLALRGHTLLAHFM